MPAGPCSHGARVGHGTSDIEDRVVSRLTLKLGRPRASAGQHLEPRAIHVFYLCIIPAITSVATWVSPDTFAAALDVQ